MDTPPATKRRVKLKQSACVLECDEDEARWDAALKRVAKQKPAPEPAKLEQG
jgi:hypothetical protein